MTDCRFHLHGPDGYMAFGDAPGHSHGYMSQHDCLPDVTSCGNGRLTLVLQLNNTDDTCWVGNWHLMVSFKARTFDAMVMPVIGDLILPVSAGPVHGSRFARLLLAPKAREATRNLKIKSLPSTRRTTSGYQQQRKRCMQPGDKHP